MLRIPWNRYISRSQIKTFRKKFRDRIFFSTACSECPNLNNPQCRDSEPGKKSIISTNRGPGRWQSRRQWLLCRPGRLGNSAWLSEFRGGSDFKCLLRLIGFWLGLWPARRVTNLRPVAARSRLLNLNPAWALRLSGVCGPLLGGPQPWLWPDYDQRRIMVGDDRVVRFTISNLKSGPGVIIW